MTPERLQEALAFLDELYNSYGEKVMPAFRMVFPASAATVIVVMSLVFLFGRRR